MSDKFENIAAQALRAMRLRRQLDSGEITQQEYLARLEALETTSKTPPAEAPSALLEIARKRVAADPGKPAMEPLPNLLSILRKTEKSSLAPAVQAPEIRTESEKKPEPLPWRLVPSRPRLEVERTPLRTEVLQRKHEPEPEAEPERAHVEEPAPRAAITSPVVRPLEVARATVSTQRRAESFSEPKPMKAAVEPAPVSQSSPRQRLPWLLAAVGGIVATIAVVQPLVVRGFTGTSRKSSTVQETALPAPAASQPELTVAQAGFVGPAQRRRIEGVLENMSAKTYTDVEVTFGLIGPNGDTMGLVTATVDRIGSHQSANFQTANVKQAAELVLKGIDTRAQ